MKSLRLLFAATITFAAACRYTPATVAGSVAAPASWTKNAVIYEINFRQYTPEGTFAALDRQLARFDSLGVDILWIMPVQPIGKLNRKGPLGSYYSISNYTAFNPEFGSATDFKRLVNDAHQHGKRVVLDWVPNHTSFDHVWITSHPDWYVHRPDGSISNARDNEGHETDWTDVAELDYDKPAMRQQMIADMRWWLDNMSIDGFRCDVAGGVPMDFWREARRALTAVKPDLFMLAEAEGPQYYPAFDATYGWELHHLLNELAQGKRSTADLDAYFARQRRDYPPTAYRMYFTSNHDENSLNGTEFERMGDNHMPAFILAATVQLGMPLIYTGQEASLRKRLRFFEKDTVDWSGSSLVGFYRAVVDLKHRNSALWNGAEGGDQVKLETDGGDRVYAFTRTRGENSVLVALNFGDAPVHLAYGGLSRPGQFTDWFTKSRVTLGSLGTIDVPAHGYRVLVR